MTYRGDIDGLRALAVIAVVFFHFDFLDGGFVGVDIFFVISGYLITKLINDAVQNGTFSIADFYVRRIRRIFPALFGVYLATGLFAFLYCFSLEAEFIGKALLSSIFFVSNIFFFNQSGYFEGDSSVNPLLHTWSLSVEEQFYIVLPLLIIALGAVAANIRYAVLGALTLISFAAASFMLDVDQSAAFYLMQYRGWEFLFGSLLAVGAIPAIRSQRMAEGLAAAGLVLIVASAAIMNKKLPFPGYGALAPCLGAALIIYAGTYRQTRVSQFLSTPPMRFIGLISYSLYLWHYPVRVFYSHIWGKAEDSVELLLIALSVAIAALSWRYIEQPFRRHSAGGDARTPVFGAAAASMAVLALVSLQLGPAVRIARQEPPQVTAMLNFAGHDFRAPMRDGTCFLTSKNNDLSGYDASQCLALRSDKKNFLIVGDSHAAHLWSGFAATYPQINFMQATASGCRPVLDTSGRERCTKLMEFVLTKFLPGKRLDGIIMAGRWAGDDIDEIKETAKQLRSFADRVIVFGPIVEYTMALPRVLALDYADMAEDGTAGYLRAEPKQVDRDLDREMRVAGIEYISLYRAICSPDCTVWAEKDTVPMQFDYGHLTAAGSRELARRVKRQLFPETALRDAAPRR